MNGQFIKIPGGYARQIDAQTQIFVPEAFVESFVPETGEVTLCAPDYAALEAEKAPAVHAAAPGAYAYTEEMQKAPTGCDFSARLAYYGKHYYLTPLHDGLPQLHGRGVEFDPERGTYRVTIAAYNRLIKFYRVSVAGCLD